MSATILLPSKRLMPEKEKSKEEQIVAAAVPGIEADVAQLQSDCTLLTSRPPRDDVAQFYRQEIRVGELLGKGSFAQVHEITGFKVDEGALEQRSCEEKLVKGANDSGEEGIERKQYAIKYLRKKLLRKPQDFVHYAADLIIEAKMMSIFDHPNILKVCGLPVGESEAFRRGRYDEFFMIMPRLHDTLDMRIYSWRDEKGDFSEVSASNNDGGVDVALEAKLLELAVDYGHQIAGALMYLHDLRIIYRDLKPENIGIQNDNTVQLFDFGLCREMPQEYQNDVDETFLMSDAGSKRYMAPEILNTGCYNLKADTYSWSMVFYEMLSLRKPYKGYNEHKHRAFVCENGERPSVRRLNLPRNVVDVMKKSWQQDIKSRLTIHQVYKELEIILEDVRAATALAELDALDNLKLQGLQIVDDTDDDDVSVELDNVFADRAARPPLTKQDSMDTLATRLSVSTDLNDSAIHDSGLSDSWLTFEQP